MLNYLIYIEEYLNYAYRKKKSYLRYDIILLFLQKKWLFGTFVGSGMVSMDNKEKDSPQFSLSISMSDGKDGWFFIICKLYLFAYDRDIEFKQF